MFHSCIVCLQLVQFVPCLLLQLQVAGFHLRTGGEQSDGATAHDPEPRLSRHLLHAATVVEGPLNAGGVGLLPEPH